LPTWRGATTTSRRWHSPGRERLRREAYDGVPMATTSATSLMMLGLITPRVIRMLLRSGSGRVDLIQSVEDIPTGSSEPVTRTKVQRPQRQRPKRAGSKRPETKTSLDSPTSRQDTRPHLARTELRNSEMSIARKSQNPMVKRSLIDDLLPLTSQWGMNYLPGVVAGSGEAGAKPIFEACNSECGKIIAALWKHRVPPKAVSRVNQRRESGSAAQLADFLRVP
jgi:hypothetical protein